MMGEYRFTMDEEGRINEVQGPGDPKIVFAVTGMSVFTAFGEERIWTIGTGTCPATGKETAVIVRQEAPGYVDTISALIEDDYFTVTVEE